MLIFLLVVLFTALTSFHFGRQAGLAEAFRAPGRRPTRRGRGE